MRKKGLEFKPWKKSFRGTFNPGFSPAARIAISNKLIALIATGSPRRSASSRARTCVRDSFLGSNNHRRRTCVSNNKRGSRQRLLFTSDNFPQVGSIHVHDIAYDFAFVRPTVAWRFPNCALSRAEHRHGAAPTSDGDGLSRLFDLAETSETFGLELRCT